MALYHHLLLITGLLLAVQILLGTVLVEAQNTNFNFSYFNTPDSFLMVDDVQYDAGNTSFKMNLKGASTAKDTCGRLLYKEKVRMKDSVSGAVASFHTAFTFQITSPNTHKNADGFLHGDGMAFTFARNSSFLDETTGSSLCLLQESSNGQASNRVFAVEFDTFWSPWLNDSSDSHIGVNINSMNSTWSYNLCGGSLRNCSYLCNGGYFTAWIDYDSAPQKLKVFFANGSLYNNVPKPPKPLIEASLASAVPLADLVDEYMYVGFSASTGSWSEVHQIQSWKFTSSGMPELVPNPNSTTSSHGKKVGITAGISAGAAAALLVVVFCIARYQWRASDTKQDKVSLVDQNHMVRMFTYKELSKATKNFSRSELLGSGGFGAVFKGTLPSGAVVAVKRMRMSEHGKESFQAEVASLSHIRHRNLVPLRGWCHEEEELLLVYEYMCHGSLDEWLFQFSKRNGEGSLTLNNCEALPLDLRHSILCGLAAALAYLHEECAQCVLHRDIKSSNVLLDGALNAYLGDFGLARVVDHQKMEKTTMMAGTLGYMAPEMPHTGKATKESDVYSFGVLLLEVVCGMRPLEASAIDRGEGVLVDRVWRAHEAGNILEVADTRLEAFAPSDPKNSMIRCEFESQKASCILVTDNHMHDADVPSLTNAPDGVMESKKMIVKLLHLGLLCCNPNPEDRPSMRLVAQSLQSSANIEMSNLPPLPDFKPHAHYSRPGFSELVIPSLSWSSSSGLNVEDAAQSPFQSIPPSSGVSSVGSARWQTSFVAPDSSVFSGR